MVRFRQEIGSQVQKKISSLGLSHKTMKTIITSNWRPLHRTLCTLLLCVASSVTAFAQQLYVSQVNMPPLSTGGSVEEYDANLGTLINSNVLPQLSVLAAPTAPQLALSGNDLFVSTSARG